MPAISVAPTRTNLIKVRKDLKFAREGHEILDRKREVLTSELVRVAHEAEVAQKEVWALLENAYSALRRARITLGSGRVEWAALAANKTVPAALAAGAIRSSASAAESYSTEDEGRGRSS